MSERLIVEFYAYGRREKPVATVLAYYGVQDPEPAAYTLTAFLSAVENLREPRFDDPQLLAARFVSWQGDLCRDGDEAFDFSGVEIIESSKAYNAYLVARIHAHPDYPHVEFVEDEHCSSDELNTAATILNQSHVGPPQYSPQDELSIQKRYSN